MAITKKWIENELNRKLHDENGTHLFHVLSMTGNKIRIKWDYLDIIFCIECKNEYFDGMKFKSVYWYDEIIKNNYGEMEKHGLIFVGNDKWLCDYTEINEKMLTSFINNMVYTICNTY